MFSTRLGQENLTYNHQQTAAAKPLNQGIKGLESKTPGPKAPKTPFRRQDENTIQFNKSGLKTGSKAKQDAFVTPAGPRTRAPLGMKTTNVKATAFQTPAPKTQGKDAKSTQKPVSPRLRRAKVKIHQAEAVAADPEDDVPEIEYMPPRSVPLPDYPDDIHEMDFARIFDPKTMLGDIVQANAYEAAERFERKQEADSDRAQKQMEEAMARDAFLAYGDPERTARREKLLAQDQAAAKASPSTISSKTAASALSTTTSSGPRFAAPTAATKARTVPLAPKSTNGNHDVATVASKSTLGYSKGRVVSASKRPGLSNAHKVPVVKKSSANPADKKVMERLAAEEQRNQELRDIGLGSLVDDDEAPLEELLKKSFGLGMEEQMGGLKLDEDDDACKDFVLTHSEDD
ncbi:hypothetical protein MBLNU457_g2929t1 [Dothideomycetes sp. NU457]